MSWLTVAGLLASAGSVLFLVTPVFTSRGVYQLPPEERVAHARDHPGLMGLQNTLLAIAAFLAAAGFVAWSVHSRDQGSPWLHMLGAAAFLAGAVAMGFFSRQFHRDPASYHLADRISLAGRIYFALTIGATGVYGVLFLQAAVPNWLGYVSLVVAAAMAVGLWRIGGKDLPPQPFYLVTLTAGIVFLLL